VRVSDANNKKGENALPSKEENKNARRAAGWDNGGTPQRIIILRSRRRSETGG